MDTCSWDYSCYSCHYWQSQTCDACCQACPPPWEQGVQSAKVPTLKQSAEKRPLPPLHAQAVQRVKAYQTVRVCKTQ